VRYFNDSPDNSVLSILQIVKEEGDSLGAIVAVEEHEEKNISNKVRVSIKTNEKVFRITLSSVRNECLNQGAGVLGHGYIQADWEMRLKPAKYPPQPPFVWHMKRILTDEEKAEGLPFPPKRILDAPLLRSLIREKLGVLPLTSPEST
jgi:hypothetical protein